MSVENLEPGNKGSEYDVDESTDLMCEGAILSVADDVVDLVGETFF